MKTNSNLIFRLNIWKHQMKSSPLCQVFECLSNSAQGTGENTEGKTECGKGGRKEN